MVRANLQLSPELASLGLRRADELVGQAGRAGRGGAPAMGPEMLRRMGGVHEWFWEEGGEGGGRGRAWHPPLTVLTVLAGRVVGEKAKGRVVCVGRACWPTFQLACAAMGVGTGGLGRWLFLDPLTAAERYWAIGEALRCPGVAVVIGDASGMDATVSRRLQLAGESGERRAEGAGALGLLARPPWEKEEASWAAGRWRVRPVATEAEDVRGWEVELLCCRGQQPGQDAPRRWMVEWRYQVMRGTGALHFSAGVGRGTADTAAGPGRAASPAGRFAARKLRPVMLAGSDGRQEIVARCCAGARRAGVYVGMPLAEARALCAEAQVGVFDGEKSRQAMGLLAKWCLRFSPVVSVDGAAAGGGDEPDGILLDVTGEAHLWGGTGGAGGLSVGEEELAQHPPAGRSGQNRGGGGGEHLLLADLAGRLGRMGFGARLAIAPTVGAAWAVARFGPHPLAVVGEAHVWEALAPLPVGALRISEDVRRLLLQVGIERVGHLLRLPRESLLVRFGEELLVRLDQAFGRIAEPIEPLHVTEPVAVRQMFDGATTQLEALFLAMQGLLVELEQRLLEKESGVRGVRVEWTRINACAVSREVILGQPQRDAKHLWGLLRPKVEGLHLGYGVEAITVTAFWTERIRHRQAGIEGWVESEGDTHDRAYAAFIDTLINRWGGGGKSDRVLRARPVASHTPEVARGFVPVGNDEIRMTNDESNPNVRMTNDRNGGARKAKAGGMGGSLVGAGRSTVQEMLFVDRPSVMLDRPEEAEAVALQPDHPPGVVRWRGREHVVRRGVGPERIATAWWGKRGRRGAGGGDGGNGGGSTRDYFKVQTSAGVWLWVFREVESGRWYVHGLWA